MKKLTFILFLLFVPLFGFAQLEDFHLIITDGLSNPQLKANVENNISKFLVACNESVISGGRLKIGDGITKEAKSVVMDMWKTSPMSCPVSKVEEICIETPNGYQVRNIPVLMLAADEDKQEQELVFSLDRQGVINDVSIAIEENKYKEIMSEHETVQDLYRRQVIIDFVESYRTSYNRKDIDYIESVFSDNALIITGKVIKEKPKSDYALRSLSSERVVYQKRTKKEYIQNLKKAFSVNKYINVVFDELEVVQHPKFTDIYGVTVKQEWYSDRYSDVGYVFLMIDFQDELHPLIQVRTWQPEKVNGQMLARDEVFNLGDFSIVRSLVND